MSEQICIHCFISGKVQGVWYRASAKAEAAKLGIVGWARNLPDGRVEVMAAGERDKLMALHSWLQQGPRNAEVREVTYEELPWQAFNDFETK